MRKVFVDFETYWDKKMYSADLLGVPNYVEKSYAYMMSICIDGRAWVGELENFDRDCPDDLKPDLDEDQFYAANANFDDQWFRRYFGKTKLPWQCVLDQARVAQYPGDVGTLVKTLFGKTIDKSIRDWMCGKHYCALTPEQKTGVLNYCLGDSVEEEQCQITLPPMSDFENQLAVHTRAMNIRGLNIKTDEVEKALQSLQQIRHDAFLAIPWTVDSPPLSYPCFAKWCNGKGILPPSSLAKTDEDCTDWMKANDEGGKVLRAMREFRRSNTLLEKIKTLQNRLVDGILPLEFIYCGAPHTRRWSCRGFNVQNLDRDPVKFEFSSETIYTRSFIIPRPGKKFVILDLAQIEPRCLAWLCEDTALLEGIRKGFPIYESYARAYMGWNGGKLKEENKRMYQTAKAVVLGAGYGCGADKFQSFAQNQGLVLTQEECKNVIDSFRRNNPKITRMWRWMDDYLTAAFRSKDKVLELELPTGEVLKHWDILYGNKKFTSSTVKGDRKAIVHRIWGGFLTENVTQRMARDVLATSILALEKAGIPVAFHAHDEVIMEVDQDNADDAYKEAVNIMRTPPSWAPTLPLDVEGGIHDQYIK